MSSSQLSSNEQTLSNNSSLDAQQDSSEHQTQAEYELTTLNQDTSLEHHVSVEEDQLSVSQTTIVQQASRHIESPVKLATSEKTTTSVQQTSPDQQTTTQVVYTTNRFEPLMTVINRIAEGENVPPQTTMQYELLRLCTLRSFPKENKPYITRLASAGFYYANESDEVVCYRCARRRRNWRESDNPIEVHKELNPNCSFLIRNSEVNVPVSQSTDYSPTESQSNFSPTNSCQSRNDSPEVIVSSATMTGSQIQAANNNSGTSSFVSSAISPIGRNQSFSLLPVDVPQTTTANQSLNNSSGGLSTVPKYPRYINKIARLTSFHDCGDIVIPPDSLATAGFFYAGFGDCVRCFQCGIGLRHWSEEDDPWIEHSRWSNECSYVRQIRGRECVNLVQMAVQYSQSEAGNELMSTQGTRDMGRGSGSAPRDIDRLMHTDAAQSVLEMGYHPDVIRRAIVMVITSTGHGILTATNIMERIFEIEDSESQQNNTSANAEARQISSEMPAATPPEIEETKSRQDDVTSEENVREEVARGGENLQNNGSAETQPETTTENHSRRQSRNNLADKTKTTRESTTDREATLKEQKKLKEENDMLKQQSLCTKCHTNDVCIVFLPCGHLVTCETCAPTVRYCMVTTCGKYIKGTVRTYLA